ncbi:MAG: alcohol dehydrogenase catalytic domain-containing protein, partial [bacterium]
PECLSWSIVCYGIVIEKFFPQILIVWLTNPDASFSSTSFWFNTVAPDARLHSGRFMQAAVLDEIPSQYPRIREVPSPSAAVGEVRVEVSACGICGTDLHILSGQSYRPTLPLVLGHEPSGKVVALGDGVTPSLLGKRVVPHLFLGCGTCFQCQKGDDRLCIQLRTILGIQNQNGGFAGSYVTAEKNCILIPDEISDFEAAAVVDSGATAFNAVRHLTDASKRDVVVVGGGPVGFIVAQILRDQGIEPWIVEPNEHRLAALVEVDHRAVMTREEIECSPTAIIECTGGSGVSSWAIDFLESQGQLILAGYAREPNFEMSQVARKELGIQGIRSGSRNDLIKVISMVGQRQIRLPELNIWPLADIDTALDAMRSGKVRGKPVIAL